MVPTPTQQITPDLSIVVPLYNEEANVDALYKRLKAVVDAMGVSYQFVFINDGSRDRTLALVHELSRRDQHVCYIDLSRNFGHQIAWIIARGRPSLSSTPTCRTRRS
jgi:glycosyltransferase involved in cell wall biosynthesis